MQESYAQASTYGLGGLGSFLKLRLSTSKNLLASNTCC